MGLLGKPTMYGNTPFGGHRAVQDTALNRVCEVFGLRIRLATPIFQGHLMGWENPRVSFIRTNPGPG